MIFYEGEVLVLWKDVFEELVGFSIDELFVVLGCERFGGDLLFELFYGGGGCVLGGFKGSRIVVSLE